MMGHVSRICVTLAGILVWWLAGGAYAPVYATFPAGESAAPLTSTTEHVILFVLEGFSQDSLKSGAMPVLSKLIKDGSVTWSANAVQPALRLPTMASLVTGLPVEKHGITWNSFEFSRGYPRAPSLFDYLDVSGGRDSAVFFMDESLYQLAKPAPYTDYQLCGALRPECGAQKLVAYIQQYFQKAASGHGYGHAVHALPHLLVVHLPEAGRAGVTQGWNSKEYQQALKTVDTAMKSVLDLFKHYNLLDRTAVLVTTLSIKGNDPGGDLAQAEAPAIPWIVSGAGIARGQVIRQPVSIIDTGATVMRMLQLETHTEWDSKVIEEIFQTDTASHPVPRAKKR
ncbi:MAG: alkaline phosphatase family protein [Nitrospira sp.]|nr:alkaline phosphatase family protein [Nitrospira sp.]MDH4302704.1 alkaline phosphatase family protein [Nitrospira sp.]MDH5192768.1 alkaline phosphatase family protein [Nitrospira sp.]